MTIHILGFGLFGCSPAGVGCLEVNDVDFLDVVTSRQDTSLWCLWLHVPTQVVQRQELGINLAGVENRWICNWRDVCVSGQGCWDLFAISPPQRGQILRWATEQHPLFLWGISGPAHRDFSRVYVCFAKAVPAEKRFPATVYSIWSASNNAALTGPFCFLGEVFLLPVKLTTAFTWEN